MRVIAYELNFDRIFLNNPLLNDPVKSFSENNEDNPKRNKVQPTFFANNLKRAYYSSNAQIPKCTFEVPILIRVIFVNILITIPIY